MLGEEGNSVPHPFESHIHVQEAGNPTQIAPWGSPDWTSFHQWPHIHPTKWSHCSFSSNTLAICKQPVILSPSTHGNPASKSQFPCFITLSVCRPPHCLVSDFDSYIQKSWVVIPVPPGISIPGEAPCFTCFSGSSVGAFPLSFLWLSVYKIGIRK